MARRLNNAREVPALLEKIEGLHLVDMLISISHRSAGR